jgi:hypothetical protein
MSMTERKITLTIDQLEQLLIKQKKLTGEYMTSNLSVYSWFQNSETSVDVSKQEMRDESLKSPYPNDFVIFKKYIP